MKMNCRRIGVPLNNAFCPSSSSVRHLGGPVQAVASKDVSRFERSVTETLAGMLDRTLPTVIANG
jgi:hypothetical protein